MIKVFINVKTSDYDIFFRMCRLGIGMIKENERKTTSFSRI